jgi:hypothetical protein
MKGYPTGFRSALIATSIAIYATGCLLAPTTLEMRAAWDLGWRLAGGARVWMAAAHAALALMAMMFVGGLWSVHMRSGWRRRRQRASGTRLGVALLLLAVTAVGVYYLADETLANATAFVHLALGLALIAPFLWHLVKGRRMRRRHHH